MTDISAITVEISKLSLNPGDVLMFKLPVGSPLSEAGRLDYAVRNYLARYGVGCLVLSQDVEVSVVEKVEG